jgi:aminopeptidase YwaD
MFEILLIGLTVPIAILVLMASARASSTKSDLFHPIDPCHPPKADTHHCKYDRAVQRRTSLAPRPPIDKSTLPPKDQRVLTAFSGVSEKRAVDSLKKLTGELPITVTRNGQQVTGTITSRSSYSKELYDWAMLWMEEQFQALGLATKRHVYAKDMYNLVATIPGDGTSKKRIVLGCHGDATAGNTHRNEKTKGADDNASGMVALLEIARAMKDMKPKYAIDFVVFTMEEQGLEGSYAYSDKVKREGTELVLMIQFDMIAYHSVEGNRMDVHDGANKNGSHKYYEMVERACAQYDLKLLAYDTHNDEMNRRSDHAGFLDHGYPALMFSEEFTDPAFNPYYHSMQDTVDKLNIPYYLEIIKLAIASVFNISEVK